MINITFPFEMFSLLRGWVICGLNLRFLCLVAPKLCAEPDSWYWSLRLEISLELGHLGFEAFEMRFLFCAAEEVAFNATCLSIPP